MHEKRRTTEEGIALEPGRIGQSIGGTARGACGAGDVASGSGNRRDAVTAAPESIRGRSVARWGDHMRGSFAARRPARGPDAFKPCLSRQLLGRFFFADSSVGDSRLPVALGSGSPVGADVASPSLPAPSRLNSCASSTCGANVSGRSIATTTAPAAKAPSAANVRRVTVGDDAAGQRLDNFLLRELKGVPKTWVYRVIRSGEVRVNSGRADADTRLLAGDEVRIPPVRLPDRTDRPAAPPREFPILLEDEHLIALDKPAGVAVHGGSGVAFGVIEQLRRSRPETRFLELVHRLDKETSGVLLIAKKRSALLALQEQFRGREPTKVYAALVAGAWPAKTKVIDVALHKYLDAQGERRVRAAPADEGRRSITLVKVAAAYARFTLLDVTLRTGRTHQIRVHLADAGHPIVGDPKYGDFALNRELARGALRFDRMFLHAKRLAFDHPASAQRIDLHAPLPPDCATLLAAL